MDLAWVATNRTGLAAAGLEELSLPEAGGLGLSARADHQPAAGDNVVDLASFRHRVSG